MTVGCCITLFDFVDFGFELTVGHGSSRYFLTVGMLLLVFRVLLVFITPRSLFRHLRAVLFECLNVLFDFADDFWYFVGATTRCPTSFAEVGCVGQSTAHF